MLGLAAPLFAVAAVIGLPAPIDARVAVDARRARLDHGGAAFWSGRADSAAFRR
jgi:hypothetical protein